MTRGLIIGKFMPLHKGHIALIEFAAAHVDELIVSMSDNDNDPINPVLRLQWIKEQFKHNPRVTVYSIKDDFDNEGLPLPERTAGWAKKMKEVYPSIHLLFSSEHYGAPFAKNLGATHILFDEVRKIVPVSATDIRNKPFTHWEFIPDHIQPYFVKMICFYGPESTGKTTMAMKMAARYNTEYVPEAARDILQSNDFTEKEIIAIARLQDQYIRDKLATAKKLLFCDTDSITTGIYSQLYLGKIPSVVTELERKTSYHHYFLMDIDTEWIADNLRDQGHRRKEMMEIFQRELVKRDIGFTVVSGSYGQREEAVVRYIDGLLRDW